MATSSSEPGPRPRGIRALIEAVLPAARFGDERAIAAGTGQNLVGLVVAMLATFATQVLITRVLGAAAFGAVTVATQLAFVGAAATRFGMDMASVRLVAIHAGRGEREVLRGVVRRAAGIAALVSVVVGAGIFAGADALARTFASPGEGGAFRAAAIALPFAALVHVYLGATRGLKVMRHTLTVYWVGQPLLWILLLLSGWLVARSIETSVAAYAGSWAIATVAALLLWRRETPGPEAPVPAGEMRQLVRYGAPRAPAALSAQLLFWTDLFVLARVAPAAEVGVYAAAVRAGQVILLFLISVNNMFSPFVADLHARGERQRLDALYKLVTRWMLVATLPILIVLAVVPDAVLHLFGEGFGRGRTALLILLGGQLVNVATGSVGFILIMVGRTGWDLVVNGVAVAFSLGVAMLLAPRYGMEGAAVAGATTLALGNLWRLALVRRLVGIQPFTRDHLRLLPPALAGA
ncbi:MAG TPA: oligosaccharide flippase family protein, partial [Actinomycetota bacterium]|nr:oligosaccharide flippase family protein [Actinomycetota bacterium]